jgi:hypothetical protein
MTLTDAASQLILLHSRPNKHSNKQPAKCQERVSFSDGSALAEPETSTPTLSDPTQGCMLAAQHPKNLTQLFDAEQVSFVC